MADADIVARMRFNATEFTSEFGKVLNFSEARAKSAGAQISGAFGGQAAEGVRSLAARIPVVGDAISGLAGPLLIGAAGFGALAAGIGAAISITEEYHESARELDAVLRATGNTTGFTSDQLKDYAETLETTFAISAEQFLKAEEVLSSFQGVAGSVFKRSVADAADLAAVYGGDVASNAEKLGTVLQNLSQGEVTGLAKGFKFLGVTTLDAIAKLAESGHTFEAMIALLDAVEKKVGGAGAAKSAGLSGAFFRLTDAVGDTTRAFAEQSGLYDAAVSGLDSMAAAAGRYADKLKGLDGLELKGEAFSWLNALANPLTAGVNKLFGDDTKPARLKPGAFSAPPLQDTKFNETFDALLGAEESRKPAQAARDQADAVERSKKAAADGAASAKQLAAEQAKGQVALEKYVADLERQVTLVQLTKEQQEQITNQVELQEKMKKAGMSLDSARADQLREEVDWWTKLHQAMEAASKASEELSKTSSEISKNFQEAHGASGEFTIDAAGKAMRAQSGVDADTRSDAEKAKAQDYAQDFYDALNGGIDALERSFQTKLGSAISTFAGNLAASVANGGNGDVGVNAKALAASAESAGLEFAIASALAPLDPLIGQVAKGIGAIVKYTSPAGWLTMALFKTPKGSVDVSTGDQGQVVTGDFSGTKKLAREVTALGAAFATSLKSIADALNGSLEANVDLGTIGQKGKKFTFDPDGKGGVKATKFKTEQEALEAAQRYAITSGALALSAGARKLASGSGDFATQLGKAAQFESVFTQLAEATDPVGAAITDLNKQFKDLVAIFNEAGASTDDVAKASQLYDLKLKAINDAAAATTATLDDFLSSLKLGPDSPLSLRDQEGTAKAKYDALSATIGTKTFDSGAFSDAGRALLDVEKALNGSTGDFFAVFDRVKADTERSIASITASQAAATGDNPFIRKGVEATADNTSALVQMIGSLPADIAAKLAGAFGAGGFIGGSTRGFVNRA